MKKYKRFMVWISENYYPSGGMGDFVDSFDTFDEAKAFIDSKACKCPGNTCECDDLDKGIFDRIEGVVVYSFYEEA